MKSFHLTAPLPKYRARAALRDQLVQYLRDESASPGAPLPSIRQLVELTGLSHVTVCRALTDLQREGWIEQRVGEGTFVGPRVETPVLPRRQTRAGTPLTRLAVMSRRGLSVRFWFLHELLDGIESDATKRHVAVELLTHNHAEPGNTRRRLANSRPDVLVSVIPDPEQIRMIGEAERLGIPCLAVGMRCPDIRLPTIHEDSAQGAGLAVEHLLANGHRRIGFITQSGARDAYMADRIDGYRRSLAQAGVAFDANWVRETPSSSNAATEIGFRDYLAVNRLSAVVVGASWLLKEIATGVDEGWLRLPADLSVVVFDQAPEMHDLLGLRLTHIAQPLFEEGRRIAELAPRLAEGETVDEATVLPCTLVDGESVAVATRKGCSNPEDSPQRTQRLMGRKTPFAGEGIGCEREADGVGRFKL